MNASATVRASYIRQARVSIIGHPVIALRPRSAHENKLRDFVHVDHIEHRQKCESERAAAPAVFDLEKDADMKEIYIEEKFLDSTDSLSVMEWEESSSIRVRLKKMVTVFPYRDPIYLVAIIFLLGSIDLVINAFFDLLPRLYPSSSFAQSGENIVAVPLTILIGSTLFFIAGVFDTFGALNADSGQIGATKSNPNKVIYRPALVGTPQFRWIPSRTKLLDLTVNSLAFQAGLIVLFGGVIFMFGGIVDFPGVVDEQSPYFSSIVFGPQVVHGMLFFVGNAMLAFSEQERWYKPKITDPDWVSAFLNTIGGFAFMMAGIFLFQKETSVQRGEIRAAIAAMVGSWAFLVGSVIRWYVVLEVW
ncbi:hypothetical protein COCC4DRAFT_81171 [Bipolaris maydis ATCC 48331]|uniref:Uncharacterized protein n=2 Tax=Cochliobolus heterostrophus TaxID=5016 RepID=M2U4Q9_COCH5|nr:uncharacterized protein COCC4DRAFT_81171 [Bipolaris maydis ATCC 48331]EMD88721.1 hypothetical protein COCHEDRAFT_1226846 [Bipolaris maydis C5]KAH7556632.1 hypothetical protein BM1_06066 [Bipolaris maydis]ENI05564.1 hypothetical protein COCC4DRAFT_81171 [Bipolaris maydis ATCC 48331]KAJ5028699.1 hypothetical protein J3E73DRAFT_379948 [Bipolaris maydis]KAJ5063487.1 hypothetical protein J3E74DRAFT_416072 [Bipolaris maydis]